MNKEEFELDIPFSKYKDSHFISILRPWINVGNVGHNAISRLVKIFDLEEIGKLRKPSKYYDMTRYRPEILNENGERKIRVPNTVIFGKKNPSDQNIFFSEHHLSHAASAFFPSDFEDAIVLTLDLSLIHISEPKPLPVTGSYNGWIPPSPLDETLKNKSRYTGPTSMTSQLSQILYKNLSVETMSLMVHIPLYIKLDDDFLATTRLLESLSHIYKFGTDFPERKKGENQYIEIHKNLQNNNQVNDMIKQFESQSDGSDIVDLSPEIESFLKDLEDNNQS